MGMEYKFADLNVIQPSSFEEAGKSGETLVFKK